MSDVREPERWLDASGDEVADALRPALRVHRSLGPSAREHARIWDGLSSQLASAPAPKPRGGGGFGGTGQAGWAVAGLLAISVAALWWRSSVADPRPPAARPVQTQSPMQPAGHSAAGPEAAAADAPPRSEATLAPAALRAPASDAVQRTAAAQHAVAAGRVRPRPSLAREASARVDARALAPDGTEAGRGDLTGELELLTRARRVVDSEPARALELTDEHGRRYRDGLFGQEREVLAIEALVRIGRRAQAATRAQRFLREHPDSAHRLRLQQTLEAP